jgi:transposase
LWRRCSTSGALAASGGTIPHEFPPWSAVYWHYAKWRRAGTWEEVNATLRECQRIALGRAAQPAAAIIDSQSVRTTEGVGHTAMTGARRSRAASGTCGWIRKGTCSRSVSTRPTCTITLAPKCCCRAWLLSSR